MDFLKLLKKMVKKIPFLNDTRKKIGTNCFQTVINEYEGRKITKDDEAEIINNFFEIIEENPALRDNALTNAIVAICNNNIISDRNRDNIIVGLLSRAIESPEISNRVTVTTLNSYKTNVSDSVINRVLNTHGKVFKPEVRNLLVKKITDKEIKTESIKKVLRLLYYDCTNLGDNDVIERIREIKELIGDEGNEELKDSIGDEKNREQNDNIENVGDVGNREQKDDKGDNNINAIIDVIIAKKIAQNFYMSGTTRIFGFTEFVPYERLLEPEFLGWVQYEYNKITDPKREAVSTEKNKEGSKGVSNNVGEIDIKGEIKSLVLEECGRIVGRNGEPFDLSPVINDLNNVSIYEINSLIFQIIRTYNKSCNVDSTSALTEEQIIVLINTINQMRKEKYPENKLRIIIERIERWIIKSRKKTTEKNAMNIEELFQ